MVFEDLKGKLVHFIGIGGVSMSGIAKCFAENGIFVQGSDSALKDSKYIEGFENLNIKLFSSHDATNISKNIAFIVKTSTVTDQNPEIIQAKEFNIPILERFEALELIISSFKIRVGISGSSGKTTTTALMWEALSSANKIKNSCIIGTVLNETKTTVFVNKQSDICVVEADESDGSFALMNFSIAIITDIDADHLDHFRYNGKHDALIKHFQLFARKTLENGGIVVYNEDCKTTQNLIKDFLPKFQNNIFSYSNYNNSSNTNVHCFVEEVKNEKNSIEFSVNGIIKLQNIKLPMIGKINAFNALPGLLVAKILFNYENNKTFEGFKGVNKRAEIVGKNEKFAVIDDYAHSPKKIKTFIESFSSFCKNIDAEFVIICEPHKYTRVASFYDEYITCFDSCDHLIMMEIFGIQGREAMNDISSEKLTIDIEKRWKTVKNKKFFIKSLQSNFLVLESDTFGFVKEFFGNERFVFFVFLGAGFSSKYAHLFWNNIEQDLCLLI